MLQCLVCCSVNRLHSYLVNDCRYKLCIFCLNAPCLSSNRVLNCPGVHASILICNAEMEHTAACSTTPAKCAAPVALAWDLTYLTASWQPVECPISTTPYKISVISACCICSDQQLKFCASTLDANSALRCLASNSKSSASWSRLPTPQP